MSGNDGTGNIEARDDWQTPKWLFDNINDQYKFTFDCCATFVNSKCMLYSDDFLQESSTDRVSWMNPPFSKAREMFEHFFQIIKKGVCIYRCDNLETSLWQDVILKNANWILITKGRISYKGKVGKGARFPGALIGFNVEPPTDFEGTLLFLNCTKNEEVKKHE